MSAKMSGGHLVMLDHLGQDVKVHQLKEGLVTIGSDPGCDIRILMPTVSPHHATVAVHANQTVVSSMAAGQTLVNGAAVSVVALRHRDKLDVGGRVLRWECATPDQPPPLASRTEAVGRRTGRGGARSRRSEPTPRVPLPPAQRMSLPTGGKQVAIVQPQRRDHSEQNEAVQGAQSSKRATRLHHHSVTQNGSRKATPRTSLDATKASLWIESRKTRSVPRRRPTPLRLAVLRRAQSAQRLRVTKIQAPSKIDHTKQAAIMLMTGHAPKPRPAVAAAEPGASPGRSPGRSPGASPDDGGAGTDSISLLELSILPNPKKSALKKSSSKNSNIKKKTESIKFDLSNLANTEAEKSEVDTLLDSTDDRSYKTMSENEVSLRCSDGSDARTPSPRRSISSRSSRILERSLGTALPCRAPAGGSAPTPGSPRARTASRSSAIVDRVLGKAPFAASRYSRRSTKSLTDRSHSTIATTPESVSRSPRTSSQSLECYSIVDLVSLESHESDRSMYGSAKSEAGSAPVASLLGSSTPYRGKRGPAFPCSPARKSKRRSNSLSTPENNEKRISINSTRISRVSRSRSRINDSDVILLADDNEDASPRSSRRAGKSGAPSPIVRKAISVAESPEAADPGTATPDARRSPAEATTPVLSIRSLLEQSSSSQSSRTSRRARGRRSARSPKRKTVGVLSEPKTARLSLLSRSFPTTATRSSRANKKSSVSFERDRSTRDGEQATTPKSAAAPLQEAVKNKHSSAKKPQSKRSIIDNLDESAIVKQLFNSPVRRKLSQSMTEFSRKKLCEDGDELRCRLTPNTMTLTGRTPGDSFLQNSYAITPEHFVSTLNTPGNGPDGNGTNGTNRAIDTTPENDPRNVTGIEAPLRTARLRRSIKNDSTDVLGVKELFARSPRNRPSGVAVKRMFTVSPENVLRRVSGVKSHLQTANKQKSPKNSLEDVRGVKELFKGSTLNDLRNISGVKRALRINSPKSDFSDVRGVKRLYTEKEHRNNLSGVSGVEELLHESQDIDSTFDQLIGKPRVRSYVKSKSLTKTIIKKQKRNAKSLHDSIGLITDNVEEWLDNELKKRAHWDGNLSVAPKSTSKSNLTRELQKLTTNTIEGNAPLLDSRSRNGTTSRSIQSEVSDRKKSASEMYSAHKLPFKKRMLVQAAGDAANEAAAGSGRSVAHSTPLKGRVDEAMAASDLRVSPIAAVDRTRDADDTRGPKKKQSTKIKLLNALPTESQESEINVRQSDSQVIPEVLLQDSTQNVTKDTQRSLSRRRIKGRVSLVIAKKKPTLSPKPIPTDDRLNVDNPMRQSAGENKKIKTPRRTRARAKKTIANVSDPTSPQADVINKKDKNKIKPKSSRNISQITSATTHNSVKTRAKVAKSSVPKSKPLVTTSSFSRGCDINTHANNGVTKADTAIAEIKNRQRRVATDNEVVKANNVTDAGTRRTRRGAANKESTVEGDAIATLDKKENTANNRVTRTRNNVKYETETLKPPSLTVGTRTRNLRTEKNIGKAVKRGKKNVVKENIESSHSKIDAMATRTRNVQSRNNSDHRGKKGKKNVVEKESENVTDSRRTKILRKGKKLQGEQDAEKEKAAVSEPTGQTFERKTRRAQKNITNIDQTAKAVKKNIVKNKSEILDQETISVGRKTRNVKNYTKIDKVETSNRSENYSTEAVADYSPAPARGARTKSATQRAATKVTRGRKAAAQGSELPERAPRTNKAEVPATSAEGGTRTTRKRKAEAQEATSREAPAKRQRATPTAPAEILAAPQRVTRASAKEKQAAATRSRRR